MVENIELLPDGLKVGENLLLNNCTNLRLLPKGLEVGENLYIKNTPLRK
jgi:hypothetical protein